MPIRLFFSILLSFGQVACLPEPLDPVVEWVDMSYRWVFDYDVHPDRVTPKGIRVDDTGQDIDLELIDQLVDEVEECLYDEFGPEPVLTEDMRLWKIDVGSAWCLNDSFVLPIDRSSIIVKIPDTWSLTCDKSQQILADRSPDEGCTAKGLTPTEECPCSWRAGFQPENVIIATPSLYLFKDPLIRLVTSCVNPWTDRLAQCASPTVPKLPEKEAR